MPLSSALYSGVTGLDTISTAISVIGDNIANVNTTGFKSRRAEFADVLGQSLTTSGGSSQLGAGSTISRVRSLFIEGTFETTGRPTDVAIEGRGFFVLESQSSRSFTRAGNFGFDENLFMVANGGERVQGFGIDPLTGLPNGQLGDIQLNTALAPPRVTTQGTISLNLDSNAPITGPFDPSDPITTSSFQTSFELFDSLGNSHSATFYFSKAALGAWDWNVTLNPNDTTTPPATPGDPVVVQGSGSLGFDASGNLTAFAGSPVSFNFSGGAVAPQSIDFSFGPVAGVGQGAATSQYAEESSVNEFTQDGFAAGTLDGIGFSTDGILSGQFSNGELIPIAQLALATFPNVEGLSAVGNNNWLSSRASGQELIGAPDSGNFGQLRASVLEQSNVDLAGEFVRLIVNQRAFQANTRTISTTSELLGLLVSLGQ